MVDSAPPAGPAAGSQKQFTVADFYTKGGFWARALTVLVAGLLIVNVLWLPLGLPATILNALTKSIGPQSCGQYTVGTSQSKNCALMVGLKIVVGPVIVGITMFLLRRRIGKLIKDIGARLPPYVRGCVPAVSATILFLMGWAAIHAATKDMPGLPFVSQKNFPILVGLVTLATQDFGRPLQGLAPGFFRARARWPLWLRIVILSAASILLSWYLMTKTAGSATYLTNPGLKEQTVVLFSLIVGWILMSPVIGGLPLGPRAPVPSATATGFTEVPAGPGGPR